MGAEVEPLSLSAKETMKDLQNPAFSGKEEDIIKLREFHKNETGALCASDPREDNEIEQTSSLRNEDSGEIDVMGDIDRLASVHNEKESSKEENYKEGLKKRKYKVKPKAFELATKRVLRSGSAARNDQQQANTIKDPDEVARKGVKDCNDNESKIVNTDGNTNLSYNELRTEVKCKGRRPSKVKKTDGSDILKGGEMKEEPGKQCDNDVGDKSSCVKDSKPLKRNRGRSPRLNGSNLCSEGGIMHKPKRLSKFQGNSQSDNHGDTLKRRRGRPPKVQKESSCQSNGESVKQKYRSGEDPKMQRSDGSKCSVRVKRKKEPQMEESDESKSEGKKRLRKHSDKPSSSKLLGSNESDYEGRERKGADISKGADIGERPRARAKQLVRDRIMELLLAAGWTVEYRPRNGRDYNDAVYINPEGKTHWSVTLAYEVYKKQCESLSNDPENSASGTGFAMLSEEETSILHRNTQKVRSDKGKPRPKDKDTNRKGVTVKNKSKHNLNKANDKEKLRKRNSKLAAPSRGNSLKRELKRNSVSGKLDGMSSSKIVKSIKNQRRQEVQPRNRCAPLARNSLEGSESQVNGYLLYEGKRSVLSWMIDSATVPPDVKVQYMNNKNNESLLDGRLTREGIRCNCCNEVFSVSDFEIHAGSKLNQPFENMYIENGSSFLQCLLESWNSQDESHRKGFYFVDVSKGDPNDDTCGICGDGGDLICCDGCPSTFHQGCLDIKKFPSGDWFCVHCSCKNCGIVDEVSNQRCNDKKAASSPLLTCCLCEEKFHQSCIEESSSMFDDSSDPSFCGEDCRQIFERLQALIGVRQELPEGFSCTFLRRFDLTPGVLLSDESKKIECNSKLAVAFFVMDECFSPIVDHRTGINLLRNIVYSFGSNFNRLNYNGFYTAILERGDEIIGVASIRFHGNQLAEMPFIGTRYMYRRQGMCRRLMTGIESALSSLHIEKLVIPAVPELTSTWTSAFGFKAVEESSKQKIRNLNMLVFPRVDMLQKPLLKHNSVVNNMMPTGDGSSSSKLGECLNGTNFSNSAGLYSDIPTEGTAGTTKNDLIVEDVNVEAQSLVIDCLEDKTDIERETTIRLDSSSDIDSRCKLVADGEIPKMTNTTDLSPEKTAVGDDIKDGYTVKESQAEAVGACFEDKTATQRQIREIDNPESGSVVESNALSAANFEVQEKIDTTSLTNLQDPGFDVVRQAEEIEESRSTVTSQTDTEPVRNTATDPKIHRFECHIA